jgi:hypothetical protein
MRGLLVLVLLAGTAHAQAPGQVQPVAPTDAPSIMDRRWSVSLSLGTLGLEPDVNGGGESVTFGMLELAGRFRIRLFVDVGLSIHGGGAGEGDLSIAGLYLDGRYRFLAERPWNLWALLSLGVASVAAEAQSDEAKQGRGSLRLGAGVERRFRAWALHAELRLIAIGENKDFEPTEISPANVMAKSPLNGGSLTIGGSFYF